MRAWRFDETGDIANLRLVEAPIPETQAGEALIRVEAAALNPADRYLVQGQYPRAGKPPFTPGRDGCGVVEKALEGGHFQPGDRVVLLGGDTGISRQGMLAEYSAVPEEWLAPLPNGWTPVEGAAGPLVLLTAWRALTICGALRAGETVLITGASGGVGSAAVILAKSLGARVAALSRCPEKRTELARLGADFTFDSHADDLEKQVKNALEGGRVDLVVENLGGPFLQRCINIIAPGGRIMVVGLLAGLKSEVTIGHLIHKGIRIEGLSVSAYTAPEAQAAWGRIAGLFATVGRRPLVDRIFSMDSVQEGFAQLAAGPMGKVVIDVSGACKPLMA
jgi:NADPH2:quinone reductase